LVLSVAYMFAKLYHGSGIYRPVHLAAAFN
jgi:hypothetical protein